jgi:hypothetical protein
VRVGLVLYKLQRFQDELRRLKDELAESRAESQTLRDALQTSRAESQTLRDALQTSRAESQMLRDALQTSRAESQVPDRSGKELKLYRNPACSYLFEPNC